MAMKARPLAARASVSISNGVRRASRGMAGAGVPQRQQIREELEPVAVAEEHAFARTDAAGAVPGGSAPDLASDVAGLPAPSGQRLGERFRERG